MRQAWKCANCGFSQSKRPRSCPRCGLVQAGKWTHQKYEILEEYLHALSLIMRNRGYGHYFIDACAGSGIVEGYEENCTINGSPLRMAKTRDWVKNRIKDKTRKPSVQCRFIEVDPQIFKLLKASTVPFSDFVECIAGDCNKELPKVLDKVPNAFTFVYIDPFGLGDPVIQYDTVERVLERGFTELFIQFSWEGISRAAGLLKNVDHLDEKTRKQARSTIKTMNSYMKGIEWQDIWKRTPSWRRRKAILELYVSGLKTYYKHIEYVEIPIRSKRPEYYLIFTTRNPTGRKIMKGIIEKKRRMGATPLEKWFDA